MLLFLVIFVLIFAVTGTGMIYSAHRKEKICSATAEGVVVRYREYTRNNHSHEYSPVVEYRVGNKILTGETNVWMSGRNFEEGVYVEIGYNPENPEEFYIRNYDLKTTYGMGMIFLAVSAGITLISILLLVLRRIHMEEKRKEGEHTGGGPDWRKCFIYSPGICFSGRACDYLIYIWGNGAFCPVREPLE